MNIFYNKAGVGDTLLISIKQTDKNKLKIDKRKNVVRIYDEETDTTVGYNIFNVSELIPLTDNGQVQLTEQLIDELNKIIADANFSDKLVADLTPKFVVGYVEKTATHPNADRLTVCQVDVGTEKLQIVCGAANVAEGQKVVVAKVGAVMPSGLLIEATELRGVASKGMICSARELGLPKAEAQSGILVLQEDAEVGTEFLLN